MHEEETVVKRLLARNPKGEIVTVNFPLFDGYNPPAPKEPENFYQQYNIDEKLSTTKPEPYNKPEPYKMPDPMKTDTTSPNSLKAPISQEEKPMQSLWKSFKNRLTKSTIRESEAIRDAKIVEEANIDFSKDVDK